MKQSTFWKNRAASLRKIGLWREADCCMDSHRRHRREERYEAAKRAGIKSNIVAGCAYAV